jgi:hypothetical protein
MVEQGPCLDGDVILLLHKVRVVACMACLDRKSQMCRQDREEGNTQLTVRRILCQDVAFVGGTV